MTISGSLVWNRDSKRFFYIPFTSNHEPSRSTQRGNRHPWEETFSPFSPPTSVWGNRQQRMRGGLETEHLDIENFWSTLITILENSRLEIQSKFSSGRNTFLIQQDPFKTKSSFQYGLYQNTSPLMTAHQQHFKQPRPLGHCQFGGHAYGSLQEIRGKIT